MRSTPAGLSLRWFLTRGFVLPDHLDLLRERIAEHGFRLVVLRQLLQHRVAGSISRTEARASRWRCSRPASCDPPACTVSSSITRLATDSNRGQNARYGDVHKGAAVRFGIYIAREERSSLSRRAETRARLPAHAAEWDSETLELRLIRDEGSDRATVADRAARYSMLIAHPGCTPRPRFGRGYRTLQGSLIQHSNSSKLGTRSSTSAAMAGRGRDRRGRPALLDLPASHAVSLLI